MICGFITNVEQRFLGAAGLGDVDDRDDLAPPAAARRGGLTDGIGSPDPNPRNLVNLCFYNII